MKKQIISFLILLKKTTISLTQLENIFSGDISYDIMAINIKELIDEGILEEISPKHNNGKNKPLAYKFRINRSKLKKELIEEIQSIRLKIQPEIDLEDYFILSEDTWRKDLPYILKVNEYLKENKLFEKVTNQEHSYNITGDEKWIDEKGGRKLLERIKLWDKLEILSTGEPLMLAVNPVQFSKGEHLHLIVENKATFYALLDTLKETAFTSLIFGSGWKVVSNISMLSRQLGLKGENKLYYFGDLDYEGITIWNSLNEKIHSKLAVGFYTELLKKNYSFGKENQQKNQGALTQFLKAFTGEEQEYIKRLLGNGGYYPQEGLNKYELDNIWRNNIWE
ncbi:Wadjet anti-phage system protein JetD domain-containing protein [Clostridium sp. CF012]|uniref:Wadjet anti-phage system protein JetD domain-containing protein n=1 Tax=Clostridium sp. CF012 TaxID=2843319 RepID=UPI001C0C8090|nr:Wadjet anti-phage system protein JetD domain-containing protein [Clostridium sp. CF012]MBU3145980.1 DUF2220 domain-containing protein [Clostridium sp. CF012]